MPQGVMLRVIVLRALSQLAMRVGLDHGWITSGFYASRFYRTARSEARSLLRKLQEEWVAVPPALMFCPATMHWFIFKPGRPRISFNMREVQGIPFRQF